MRRIAGRWTLLFTKPGRSLVVGAVLIATLSGCTEAPLASSPATVDMSSPVPSSAPTGLFRARRPATMLPADQTRGLESTPWSLTSGAGMDLAIKYVAGGGCSRWKGVRVKETLKSVEVWTAVETSHRNIRRIRVKYSTAGRPAATKVDLYKRAIEDGFLPSPTHSWATVTACLSVGTARRSTS